MTLPSLNRLLLAAGALFLSLAAHAHSLNQGYIFLRVYDNTLDGVVEMTIEDLNTALGLSLATDQSVTTEDIEPHIDAIHAYLRERISLAVDGGDVGLPLTDFDLTSIPLAQYLRVRFSFTDLPAPPEKVAVNYNVLFDIQPSYRGMLVIEHYWKTATFNNEANVSLVFSPGDTRQTLDLTSSSVWQGFAALVGMGTHHIWIGIDHILFLLALLLPAVVIRGTQGWTPATSFKSSLIYVIKVVTVFTIAHTITLSLAALGKISLSPRLVESVIAISIAIAALDILVPVFKQRIWWIVFAFGLFHGFGFASVLGDIGISPRYMVHSLLGFNLGVEIGQIVIVCILFPLLYLLRRSAFYTRGVMTVGALGLISVAMYWFVERALEIDLPAGAIVNKMLAVFT